jgi:hypothetical protein
MRLLQIPFLFLTLFAAGQDIPTILHAQQTELSQAAFLLTKAEYAHELSIIRRLPDGYVIVRNTAGARLDASHFSTINDEWKWAKSYGRESGLFLIECTSDPSIRLRRVKMLEYNAERGIAEVEGSIRNIRKELLALPSVTFIQKKSTPPNTESRVREHNLALNGIRAVHSSMPDLVGATQKISIKEGAFDPADIDIAGRASLDDLSSGSMANHATDMATLAAGAGNSFINGRGVAKGATLFSENFEFLFPSVDNQFMSRGVTVQNHSYGVGIENFYGVESVAYDQQAHTLPSLLHVFSAGNSGSQTGSGSYEGLTRYGTLTGSFKQAKNVLLVTSTNHFGEVLTANSAGPAYDGRIKPELSAFGNGGTSDAAALVSGSAALIQAHWNQLNDELPTSDMLKAVLIAGADDSGEPGPDFFGGYGQLNLRKSMEIVSKGWWFEGTLSQGQDLIHQIEVDNPHHQLTVVLAWRDPAANSGDAFALVNDLDLAVIQNTTEWLPWTLDSSPTSTALATPATPGVDRKNTVEVIRIDDLEAGTYDVAVHGFSISESQPFAIAYYLDPKEHFVWKYPTTIDPQEAGKEATVYFDHNFPVSGTLAWDDLSDNWTAIGSIHPGERDHSFTLPEVNSAVVLRATFGTAEFKSDTFRIAPKPDIKVALFCEDELIVNWSPTQSDAIYEVNYVSNGQLNILQTSTDTFAIVNRSEIPSIHFTVRQLGEYADGLPDETIRVDQQAVGCYLNNFLVSVDAFETVNLQVNLSLPDRVQTLRILKVDPSDSSVLSEIIPSLVQHSFSDANLVPGLTAYYAQLITNTGLEILSEPFELFSTDDKKYILFPNPVTDGFLNLLSPEPNAVFQVLQLDGKPLFDFLMTSKFESFPIDLSKGTYLYRVIKNGRTLKSGKFVVGS